jgi:hypothetical protein
VEPKVETKTKKLWNAIEELEPWFEIGVQGEEVQERIEFG